MTLLDDPRPVRPPRATRRLPRFLAWIPAALLVGTAVGFIAYRDHYQPLDHGGLGGLGSASGLLTVNDGLQDTAYVITAAASPTTQIFSMDNRGRFDVKVLSIGGEDGGDIALSVKRMGAGGQHSMEDLDSLPFHPFVLHAGESRAMLLAISATRCTSGESGGTSWVTGVRVRYRFWGRTHETWVPLEKPIYRSCPDGPLHPHVTPAPNAFVSRLVPTDDLFAVPKGWIAKPLENSGGPASFATWAEPHGRGKVTYEVNGGSAGLYDADGHLPVEGARDAAGCRVTQIEALDREAYVYTCAAPAGLIRRGIVRTGRTPHEFERIEIVSADKALVAEFIDSVKA